MSGRIARLALVGAALLAWGATAQAEPLPKPSVVLVFSRAYVGPTPRPAPDARAARIAELRAQTAAATAPDRPDRLLELGALELAAADDAHAAALDAWQRRLDAEPHDVPEAPSYDGARAIEALTRLVEDHPDHPRRHEAWYLLGWVAAESGDLGRAARAWEASLAVPGGRLAAELRVRLGDLAFDGGRHDAAALHFAAGAALGDERFGAVARFKLAWTRTRQGRVADGFDAFSDYVAWADAAPGDVRTALRTEALSWLAVLLMDEDWDRDGRPDADAGPARLRARVTGARPHDLELARAVARDAMGFDQPELARAAAELVSSLEARGR